MYISRLIEQEVTRSLQYFPVVAITGPRQCGKSTLVKFLSAGADNVIHLDMERPSDLRKLDDAEWFLSAMRGKRICIDEIQRKPELFPVIRTLTDEWDTPGAFIITGSASRDLLRQTSETLAGRIAYKRLTPFLWDEIAGRFAMEQYLAAGGFPRSLLAPDPALSMEWRLNYISTFLERDLLQWVGFTPNTMLRLWRMLAHLNGQTVNYASLAKSLDISAVSVKHYIDLLASTYMLETIPPYFSNLGKRLIKAPKIYIADAGITAALLGLHSYEEMLGHPSYGTLWEQIVLINLRGWLPHAEIFHYRTANGAEIDFVVQTRNALYALECKASSAPTLSKGNYLAFADVQPKKTFVVCPVSTGWPLSPGIDVVSLGQLKALIAPTYCDTLG